MKSNTKLIIGTIICVGIVGGIVSNITDNSSNDNSSENNAYDNFQADNGYNEQYSGDIANIDNNNAAAENNLGTESVRDKFISLMNDANANASNSSQSNTNNSNTNAGSTTTGSSRFNTSGGNTSNTNKMESGVTIVQIGGDNTDNSESTKPSVPTVKPSVPSTNTNTNTNTNTGADTNTSTGTNSNTSSKPNINTNTKPSVSTPSSTSVPLDTTGDYSGLRLKRQSDRNDFTLHNLNKSKINTADSLTGTEKPLIVAVNAFNAYKNQDGDSMAKLHYPNTKGASNTSITENPFVAYKVLGYEKLSDSDIEKLNDSLESAKRLYGYNFDIIATEYYRITMEIYQYEPTESNPSPYRNYEPDPYYFTALVYKADSSYYLHSFMTAK